MIEPGANGVVERTVTEEMTARALGSGDVEVLGTPAVLALLEEAAVAAIRGGLEGSQTSVGSRVEIEHLAPTPVGATVRAEATVTAVEGKRVSFALALREGDTEVARGTHTRAIVDRDDFLARSEKG